MIQRQVSRLIILTAIIIGAVLVATLPNPNRLPNEASGSAYAAEAPSTVPMAVERLDPGLDSIISAKPTLQKVATGPGFKWTEGPVWIPAGYLLFAEIPSNSIRKWTPGDGCQRLFTTERLQGFRALHRSRAGLERHDAR